jgi:hypothetical protein
VRQHGLRQGVQPVKPESSAPQGRFIARAAGGVAASIVVLVFAVGIYARNNDKNARAMNRDYTKHLNEKKDAK